MDGLTLSSLANAATSWVMVFLLIAALIEAYWSSTTAITPWIKYLVGAALWPLVAAYLILAGRAHHAPE